MGSQVFVPFFVMIHIIHLSFLPVSFSEIIQLKNQSDTFKLGFHSAELVESRIAPLAAFGIVSGIIGIAGTALSSFGLGWSFGTSPKATNDDIIKELQNNFEKLNTKIAKKFETLDVKTYNLAWDISRLRSDMISGFNAMELQLATVQKGLVTVYQTLQKIELSKYSDVEVAVQGALSDIRYNSTLDLLRRATNLCDQLNFYMGGLLGTNRFTTDILILTISPNKCLSSNAMEKMDNHYGLMSLGLIGLGFYSKLIGPEFNGHARLLDFLSQKDALMQRIEAAKQVCG